VIAADDAAIEDAQLNLGFCVLHAPMDGRVGLRRVDPGNLLQANNIGLGILSVAQVRPIAMVCTLPKGDLPRVREASARSPHDLLAVLADSSDGRDELARGTLLMLLAAGYELTVIAIVGIVLLIGIVKKNGIILVDFAINAERIEGAAPLDAIRQACLLRFRPILMTTMAVLLSGLALSQVLTLCTTPVI